MDKNDDACAACEPLPSFFKRSLLKATSLALKIEGEMPMCEGSRRRPAQLIQIAIALWDCPAVAWNMLSIPQKHLTVGSGRLRTQKACPTKAEMAFRFCEKLCENEKTK